MKKLLIYIIDCIEKLLGFKNWFDGKFAYIEKLFRFKNWLNSKKLFGLKNYLFWKIASNIQKEENPKNMVYEIFTYMYNICIWNVIIKRLHKNYNKKL